MKRRKFNFNCPNKVSEFFQKNSGIIIKSLALAIVSVLIKDLGLSDFSSPRLQFGSEKTEDEEKKTPYNSRFMMPPSDTPIKETIAGLWTNGLTAKSDFFRSQAVEDIYKIVSRDGVDAATIQYGIMAISKVSQGMNSDYYKQSAASVMSKLAIKSIEEGEAQNAAINSNG